MLIVEPEDALRKLLKSWLVGLNVETFFVRRDDERIAQSDDYDAILINVGREGESPESVFARFHAADDLFRIALLPKARLAHRGDDQDADFILTLPLNFHDLELCLKATERATRARRRLKRQVLESERKIQFLNYSSSNLAIATNRLNGLFEGLPSPCFTFDSDGLIQEWNQAAELKFGLFAHEVFLKPVWEVFPGEVEVWGEESVRGLLAEGSRRVFEWKYGGDVGELKYWETNLVPIRDAASQVVGVVANHADVTEHVLAQQRQEIVKAGLLLKNKELVEKNQDLSKLAFTDTLTGLYNRRGFQSAVQKVLMHTARRGIEVSLVLLDIDFFKKLNDDFGHLTGDEALREIGHLLTEHATQGVVAGRYGGEEFAVLVPYATAKIAAETAERIRLEVSSLNLVGGPISASFGTATSSNATVGWTELFERADAALYASKRNGRNRVTQWHPEISAASFDEAVNQPA